MIKRKFNKRRGTGHNQNKFKQKEMSPPQNWVKIFKQNQEEYIVYQ